MPSDQTADGTSHVSAAREPQKPALDNVKVKKEESQLSFYVKVDNRKEEKGRDLGSRLAQWEVMPLLLP